MYHAQFDSSTHSQTRGIASKQGTVMHGCHIHDCSAGDGRKRWLAYNMLGGISSREDDGFCAVEVSFHDAAQHRRVPLLTDFYQFSMASLSKTVNSLPLLSSGCSKCPVKASRGK